MQTERKAAQNISDAKIIKLKTARQDLFSKVKGNIFSKEAMNASDLTKYPYQIYQDMLKYIPENHSSVVKIPSKNGVNNIIKRVRAMTNTDISAIEAEPHSKTSSGMQFLRLTMFGDIDGITYRYA
ncbi:hypothetical protein RF11_07172 [Thelohanellus kitauei]|uniref:Uncharacterized protein n=1 Tax=Thelohanellus kitauei TaxID=669202 RepID=A0A0C2J8V8_THEKT|nr:hypothetical protein RF11_07172 [Thelohanellus kitauei]